MKPPSPNFLTCPAFPELRPPEAPASSSPEQPHSPPPKKRPDTKPRTHGWKWIAAIAVIIVLVATVPAGVSLVRAATSARDVKEAVARAKEKASLLDFDGAQTEIDRAEMSLDRIRVALHALGFWRDAPGLGTQVRAVEDAASAARDTLSGVSELLSVFQAVTDALRGGTSATTELGVGIAPTRRYVDLSKEEKREIVQRLFFALPKLRVARDKIDLALELWNRVPQDRLVGPIRTALLPLAETLPVIKRTLDQAVPLADVGIPLAGYPKPVHALILLQNADELRPAGGFIGTIGTATMDGGDLSSFAFGDVYKIDGAVAGVWKEVPPKPIEERLGVRSWFLRDANWSPDFPTSASKVLDFYIRERALIAPIPPAEVPDVVLAFEPGFFSALLTLTGPITVEGKRFDAQNFFSQLEYEVEQGFLQKGIPVEDRKALVEKVGTALIAQLMALPSSQWPDVLNVITKALERRQILLYARGPELLAAFDAHGWTGRAKPTDGDFLWVIDANLAALKTDGVMKKRVNYHMDARDSSNVLATVTLTYTNTNRIIDWQHTRYRSYTRVYVPEGSTLVSSSGAMKDDRYRTGGIALPGTVDVTKELGKTVFGAFWSIEPGQTGVLRFTYRLPSNVGERITDGSYRIDWPKQPGADATQLTLDLLFGKNVLSASPAEDREKWGDAKYEYQTDSLEDARFEVEL